MSTDTHWPEWPAGVDRIILDEVDSTMAEAARLAPELTQPTWILARRQTQGRGRYGQAWELSADNFAATLIFKPNLEPAGAALYSFVMGQALYQTLNIVAPGAYQKKWPNDILLNGGKLAGILLESSARARQVDWLSIGVGVNLAHAPEIPEARFRPVSIAGEMGTRVDPLAFLAVLADSFAQIDNLLFRPLGFAGIRQIWLKEAARLGEEITARTGREEIHGVFETVDETGNLVLSTPQGRRSIAAAEVYF